MNRQHISLGIIFLSTGVTFVSGWFHFKSAGNTPPILPILIPVACVSFIVSLFYFYKSFSN